MQVLNLVASGWFGVGGCTVDASEIWRGVKTSWGLVVEIPFFLQGFICFIDIPGGWPWDFWTINSINFHLLGLGGSLFPEFSWLSLHKLQKTREFWGSAIHTNMGEVDRIEISDRISIFWKKNTCQFMDTNDFIKWGCEANLGIGNEINMVFWDKNILWTIRSSTPASNINESINHNSNTANPLTWRNSRQKCVNFRLKKIQSLYKNYIYIYIHKSLVLTPWAFVELFKDRSFT